MERNREGRRAAAMTVSAVPSVTRRPRVKNTSDDEDRLDDTIDLRVWEGSKKERLATFHVSGSMDPRNKRKRQVVTQDLGGPTARLSTAVEDADESVEETEGQASEDDDEPPPPPFLRRPAKARVLAKEDELVMDIPAVPRKAWSSMSASSRYSSMQRRQPELQPHCQNPDFSRQKFTMTSQNPLNGSSSPNNVPKQGKKLFVSTNLTKKILQEAQKQQKEIQKERDEETGITGLRAAFSSIDNNISSDDDDEEGGFSDSQSYDGAFEEIPEEEEKILAMFMADKVGPQKTLADIIMQKIHEHDISAKDTEERPVPAVDVKVIEVYRGVGKLMSRYTSGKVSKAFKIIPSLSNWEEVLYLTEPENWSACAMYQATRIFASNLNAKMAQRFYNLVLLPRVREDINSNKRLHFTLYQALKKSVYKPSAFYKGVLLPLCQSRTCNLREAVIIGSVIQKVSIPSLHSSVALLKIAEMEYCGTNSYFMKLLLDKKYALPYRVLDGVMAHFMRFLEDDRTMPVIWHQCLLSFIQRYKNELKQEDKENLEKLMRHHKHYLVTPEIKRELHHSCNQGSSGADVSMDDVNFSVGIKTTRIEEDIWNLPEVPLDMEE